MKIKLFSLVLALLLFTSMFMSFGDDALITADKDKYIVGEKITVSFTDANGDNKAWIGLYPDGTTYQDAEDYDEAFYKYVNTDGEDYGENTVTEGTVTFDTTGFDPGTYQISYYNGYHYNVGATITIEITEDPNKVTPSPTPSPTPVPTTPVPKTSSPSTSSSTADKSLYIYVAVAVAAVAVVIVIVIIILKRKSAKA